MLNMCACTYAFSYKQAQAALAKALPKLKEMKIPTKRPEDYFAEMVKTDDHMQRVIDFDTTAKPTYSN